MTDQTEPTEVGEIVDFLLSIDGLKQVVRQNPLVSGQRRERTAEHSWHVAMAVLCLYPYVSDQVDLGRALELAIVHDLPELVVGDTFVYGPQVGGRRAREEPAMNDLTSKPIGRAGPEIMKAWQDYEHEMTPEGRFVMAIDVLLPIFINLAAGARSSWARHQVAASDVKKRVDHVRETIPLVTNLAYQAIDKAVAAGLLR